MAITLTNAARTAKANALLNLLNAGTTNPSGRILVKTSGGTLLGTATLSATAFGSASNGVATSNTITRDDSADATGTIAKAEFIDRDTNLVFTVDVNTSSSDSATLTMASTSVTSGQPIEFGTLTYTEATTNP